MKKIKFDFSKKKLKKLFSIFLRYRYLLILIFFSAFLAFVFNVVHRYAYVDISFVEYKESYEDRVISNIKKGNRIFKEISMNIEERDERFEVEKNIKYNNPFEFRELNVLESNELEDYNNGKDDDLTLSLPENSLIPSEPAEAENNLMLKDSSILPESIEEELAI